ncbi:MAG: hypothetical protein ACI9K2_007598 [Myxococcota bacterium]|jgi:hypothetical protein
MLLDDAALARSCAVTDMRDSLVAAALEAGVPVERFHPVRHPRWQAVLGDILDRFTRSGRKDQQRLWLWNDLKDAPATLLLQAPDETLELSRSVLPPNESVWLVAEDSARTKQRGSFWVFATDTEAVTRVLGEHHPFEYTIVGRTLGWMVAENHHDALMAVGEPVASRLDALRRARSEA